MSNASVAGSVTNELFWDANVGNAAIQVSADHGVVTLRGTVGSSREKHEAERAAQRVIGVVSVKNELEVSPLDQDTGGDPDRHRDGDCSGPRSTVPRPGVVGR